MLNLQDSLLIIIDIQDKLVSAANNGAICADNASKLVKSAQILNIPTIITEQYPKGLGHTVSDIDKSSTKIIEKTYFSAFLEEDFREKILSANKKQIIICGIETHICVLQTAAHLQEQGYEVYVVNDASSSRNEANHITGLDLLRQYNVKITSTEIVLFQWLKTSKNPCFKEIQALIK